MQLSRLFITGEAEWSVFRLTRSRASTQYGTILAAKIVLFLLDISIIS